jgi:hypothetical protein
LSVRLRQLVGTTTLILALSIVPAVAAHAQSGDAVDNAKEQPSASDLAADLETMMAATLEANPGSKKTGESTVLLKPGVMLALPDGEVGLQAANDCRRGWLCSWPHSDFRGPMLAVQDGTYLSGADLWYYRYDENDWSRGIQYCVMSVHCNDGNWRPYYESITSIYNNTHTITWAPYWSRRNNVNYYALNGAPSPYVGAKWNDSFTQLCACR